MKEKNQSLEIELNNLQKVKNKFEIIRKSFTQRNKQIFELRTNLKNIETERDKLREAIMLESNKNAENMNIIEKTRKRIKINQVNDCRKELELKLESIQEKFADKDSLLKSFNEKIKKKTNDIDNLNAENQRLKKVNSDLLQEKISQLQDSFIQKLNAKCLDEVEQKTNAMRITMLQEKENALRDQREYLTRKFQTEKDLTIQEFESQKKIFEERNLIEVQNLQSEIQNLNNKFIFSEKNFIDEKESLNNKIKSLEGELERFKIDSRSTIASESNSLLVDHTIQKLKRQLTMKEQEIEILKQTVHRECEERVELISKIEYLQRNKK
ncbi:hypothetical protein ROZALSC1DRAFT_23247 [Rozella allomycis CSF55]|uniref:Uncharacterized protein n=1 Tax=Rozella allomycis (strain CSF55) TaxID=988480 RepID=A0A4P9YG21_ROZAC|nr:hypothetical protein ROZALSC1DRAFT_23247 [Rozella allomycis CSF55]